MLNHRTAPKCPVVWAVRMSMSIPFAWQEVRWLPAWGSYRLLNTNGTTIEKEIDLTGHAIVDGGVLSNFSYQFVHIFSALDHGEYTGRAAKKVLGLLIDEIAPRQWRTPPPKGSRA